jgi:hypothetical protein
MKMVIEIVKDKLCRSCHRRLAEPGKKSCTHCLNLSRKPTPDFYWDKKGIYV